MCQTLPFSMWDRSIRTLPVDVGVVRCRALFFDMWDPSMLNRTFFLFVGMFDVENCLLICGVDWCRTLPFVVRNCPFSDITLYMQECSISNITV